MTHFAKVANFQLVERWPGYDKINNPNRLNVAELTSIEATWTCNGASVAVKNTAGVVAVLLRDLSGVAIVEAPYDGCENRAYFVNCDGSERVRVIPVTNLGRVVFYDVFYSGKFLVFLGASSSGDIQVQVSDFDGKVINIKEFR